MPEYEIPITGKLKKIPDDELDNYVLLTEDIAMPVEEFDLLIQEVNEHMAKCKETGNKPTPTIIFAMNILAANKLITTWGYKHDA